jgi:hypothetical protein
MFTSLQLFTNNFYSSIAYFQFLLAEQKNLSCLKVFALVMQLKQDLLYKSTLYFPVTIKIRYRYIYTSQQRLMFININFPDTV